MPASPRITIVLPEELYKLARRRKQRVSDLVREAVAEYLGHPELAAVQYGAPPKKRGRPKKATTK